MRARVAVLLAAGCGRGFFDPAHDCGIGDGAMRDSSDAQRAQIAFVQSNSATATSSTYVFVNFSLANQAGDLAVIVLTWAGSTSPTTIADQANNSYMLAAPPYGSLGFQQAVYIAPNIVAKPAGGNGAGISFAPAFTTAEIRVLEYSGLVGLDGSQVAQGTSGTADSGALVTTHAHDLLLAAVTQMGTTTSTGPGFTPRLLTPAGDLVEDREVLAAGSYDATATFAGTPNWVIQLVALRAND